MGQVLLVRHGQASWGAADYDVLSPTGAEQARVLGRFLEQLRPEVVVHGSMQRQRRTAEEVVAAAGWPIEVRTDARWDELDHLELLAAHPQPAGTVDGEPDRRQFQAWFEAATERWTGGEHDGEYAESFPAFRDRVTAALDALLAEQVGTAVVVTSGGPIASLTSSLLDAGTATYVKVAPVVVNTSVTRLVTGRRGVTLVSFNEHAHLHERPELLTYR